MRAGAFSPVYIANTLIYALVSLYLYIIILSFILKISYMHSLIILLLVILYLAYLSFAKSKLYILYLSHMRAGVRVVRAFSGAFSGVRAGLSANRSFCGWSAGVRGVLRARSCVFSRACGRGGVPPPFSARAQSLGVYSLIVYGEYVGEYRVGGAK